MAEALGFWNYFHARHIPEVLEEILVRQVCNKIHKTYLV